MFVCVHVYVTVCLRASVCVTVLYMIIQTFVGICVCVCVCAMRGLKIKEVGGVCVCCGRT